MPRYLTVATFSLCLALLQPCITLGADLTNPYTDPVTGMEFVLVQGGTFMMGDPSESFGQPAHQVTVPTVYIGKYEVTFDQFDVFCDQTGHSKPNDMTWGRGTRPVINVSWFDAVAFADWLSRETGRTFRLPTEAEWEYAARAGSTTRYHWGDTVGSNHALCKGCVPAPPPNKTLPIGSFPPNALGLHDMSGNVYEWGIDVWHDDYQGAPVDGSAWLSGERPNLRIDRGGSWRTDPEEVTSGKRCYHNQTNLRDDVGFRLVMEP